MEKGQFRRVYVRNLQRLMSLLKKLRITLREIYNKLIKILTILIISLCINTLIQLISDVSQGIKHYWDGIDCYVEVMGEGGGRIFFIKQIQRGACTRPSRVLRRLWLRVWITQTWALFTMPTIIIFVQSGISSFQRTNLN